MYGFNPNFEPSYEPHAFYDPAASSRGAGRAGCAELDLGSPWTDEQDRPFNLSWISATGELIAMRDDRDLTPNDEITVLGILPTRADLDAVLPEPRAELRRLPRSLCGVRMDMFVAKAKPWMPQERRLCRGFELIVKELESKMLIVRTQPDSGEQVALLSLCDLRFFLSDLQYILDSAQINPHLACGRDAGSHRLIYEGGEGPTHISGEVWPGHQDTISVELWELRALIAGLRALHAEIEEAAFGPIEDEGLFRPFSRLTLAKRRKP